MKVTFKIYYVSYFKCASIEIRKGVGFYLHPTHLIYPNYNEVYQTYKRRLKLEYIF